MRRAPLVMGLALLAACGPAHTALKEGRIAAAADRHEDAFAAYDRVLRSRPNKDEARAGKSHARARILDAANEALTRALAAGDLDGVRDAIEYGRRHEADEQWIARWDAAWTDAWVRRMDSARVDADERGSLGESWTWANTIAEFTGQPEHDARATDAWNRLRRQEWQAVALIGRGVGADATTDAIAASWTQGPWKEVPVIRRAASAGILSLTFNITDRSCTVQQVGQRAATHTYTDGTMVNNPRIVELQRQIRSDEQQRLRAWNQLEQLRSNEDRAFRSLEAAGMNLDAFLPVLDTAVAVLNQSFDRRERAAAAVTQAQDAARRMDRLQAERSELRAERRTLGPQRDAVAQQRVQVDRSLEHANRRLQPLKAQMREVRAERNATQEALNKARESLKTAKDRLTEIRAQLEELDVPEAEPDAKLLNIPLLKERLEEADAALAAAEQGQDADALAAATEAQQAARVALLQAQLRKGQSQRRRRATAVKTTENELARQQGMLDGLSRAVKPLKAEQTRLVAERDTLGQRAAEIAARLVEIEQRQVQIRQRQSRIEPLAAELESRTQRFRRAASAWRAADEALQQLRVEGDQLQEFRLSAEQEHRQVRAQRLQARTLVDEWDQALDTLDKALADEPGQIELQKRASYTITRHRRTCVSTATLTTSSPFAAPASDTVVHQSVHEDDTTPARPRIRLRQDALNFGSTDGAQLQALSEQTSGALAQALTAQVHADGSARRTRVGQTLDTATRNAAMAEFMDPKGALQSFVQARYPVPQ
ncbi:MAG: hypothetical protein AB8H79_02670 [Myxococcota bacterium]